MNDTPPGDHAAASDRAANDDEANDDMATDTTRDDQRDDQRDDARDDVKHGLDSGPTDDDPGRNGSPRRDRPIPLPRVATGLAGFDEILRGGIPTRSICVIAGRPGAGKTVLTHQILFEHLSDDCHALYLTTMAEPSVKMVRYMQSFSFADHDQINRSLHYLDLGESLREDGVAGAIERIEQAIRTHRPRFVCVDSFKAIDRIAGSQRSAGEFAHRLAILLATWEAIGVLVGEYEKDDIRLPVFTVADMIVMLHTDLHAMYPQRFLEVLKLRGSGFASGFHPFQISGDGVAVYPRVKIADNRLDYPTSDSRVESGIDELDAMLEGGLQSGTATMLAGASGTGKTLLGLQFVMANAARGQRSVIVSFQENPRQLAQIAGGFGWDLEALKADGRLTHVFRSPVEIQIDTHFHRILNAIEESETSLVVLDSLKDLENAAPDMNRYKDFLYSMINELKMRRITVVLTNEIPELFGPFKFSDHGVSFITDTIILLRYVELSSRMSRAINVMKMRGSEHSKMIREFAIDSGGISLGQPITAYTGVMTGLPTADCDDDEEDEVNRPNGQPIG